MELDSNPVTGSENKDYLWGVRGIPDMKTIQGVPKESTPMTSLQRFP